MTEWNKTQAEYEDLLVSDRERKAKEIMDQRLPAPTEQTEDQAEAAQPETGDSDLARAHKLIQSALARRRADAASVNQALERAEKASREAQQLKSDHAELKQRTLALESEVARLNDKIKVEITTSERLKERLRSIDRRGLQQDMDQLEKELAA